MLKSEERVKEIFGSTHPINKILTIIKIKNIRTIVFGIYLLWWWWWCEGGTLKSSNVHLKASVNHSI